MRVRVTHVVVDHDPVGRVDEHFAAHRAFDSQRRALEAEQVVRGARDRAPLLAAAVAHVAPTVRAVLVERDSRVALEALNVRVAFRRFVQEAQEARRQHDPVHARLDPIGEDLAATERPTRARVDVARRERDLAVEDGRHAALRQHLDRGVRVEAAVDLVVVDLHLGIPAVDELREARERQPRHRELRRELLAALLRAHVDDDSFDAGRVADRHRPIHRRVRLAVLLPRDVLFRFARREAAGPGLEASAQHRVLARRDLFRAPGSSDGRGRGGREVRLGRGLGRRRLRGDEILDGRRFSGRFFARLLGRHALAFARRGLSARRRVGVPRVALHALGRGRECFARVGLGRGRLGRGR